MHEQIRRLEHHAEQLAIRFEELADRPDTTRIALAGIFTTVGLCWFAVAWGEGLLLLALPLVAAACIIASKVRRPEHDPMIAGGDRDLGPEGAEIDAWLTRLTTKQPLPEPDEPRAAFAAPAPSFEAPLLPPPRPRQQQPQPQPLEIAEEDEEEAQPEEMEADVGPLSTAIYEVSEIRAGARVLLEVRATFDAAVDAAFELIQERDPPELDIVLVRGEERESAWAYNRENVEAQPRGSLELFGFDATRWTGTRR